MLLRYSVYKSSFHNEYLVEVEITNTDVIEFLEKLFDFKSTKEQDQLIINLLKNNLLCNLETNQEFVHFMTDKYREDFYKELEEERYGTEY